MLQLRKLLSRLDHSLALLVGIDMFLKGNGCQERVEHHQSTSIEHDLPKNIEAFETMFCWGMVCRNLDPEIDYILNYIGPITRTDISVYYEDLVRDKYTMPYLPFHFVTDEIVKQLFNSPSLSPHCIYNAFVNSFENEWHCTHQGWSQQIGISFYARFYFCAFVCQCIRGAEKY